MSQPEKELVSVVESETGVSKSKDHKRTWFLRLVVGVLFVSLAAAVFLFIQSINTNENNSTTDEFANAVDSTNSTPQKSERVDQAAGVLEEIEKDKQRLLEEKQALDATIDELKSMKRQLQQELDDLVGQRDILFDFQKADVVLLNPGVDAVALCESSGRLCCISKAKSKLAEMASRVAFKSGIQRIQRLPKLTSQVFNRTEVGEELSSKFEQQVRREFRVQRYLPFSPDEDVQMVVFQEVESQKYKVGYYIGHDENTLVYRGFDSQEMTLSCQQIVPGTAAIGSPSQVFENVDEIDFVQYGSLQIARHLCSPTGIPTHVHLVIKSNVDLPKRLMQNSPRLWVQWKFTDNLSIKGDLGSFFKEPKDSLLDKLALELEDNFCDHLTKIGIPVFEHNAASKIVASVGGNVHGDHLGAGLNFNIPIDQFAESACATHVAILEVADSSKPRHYRVSIKLVDAYTNRIIWSETSHRPFWRTLPAKYQFVKSGKLVVVNDPQKVQKIRKSDNPQIPDHLSPKEYYPARLSLNEPYFNTEDAFALRSPAAQRFELTPKSTVHGKASYPLLQYEDIPHQLASDLIVWAIVDSVAPTAGRVVQISEDRFILEVKGAKRFVSPGDKMKVVSYGEGFSFDVGELTQKMLTVVEIDEDSVVCKARISPLHRIWEYKDQVFVGDVAYPVNLRRPMIAVENPIIQEPGRELIKRIGLNNRNTFIQYKNKIDAMSVRVGDVLREGCTESLIDVVEGTDAEAVSRKGATHLVRTKISLLDHNVYELGIKFFKVGSDEPIREFHLKINEKTF